MENKTVEVRPHFIYVFSLLYPYLTLLIIPAAKEAFGWLAGHSAKLSELFAAEVVWLSVAFAVALIKLRKTVLVLGEEIIVSKGLFCRINYKVEAQKSRVIVLESNPILRPFGIYRLKIYTEGGVRRRPDESLPINRQTAEKIYRLLKVDGQAVRSNTFGNVLMSAALSSSIAGWLLAAPIVKIVSRVLGDGMGSFVPMLKNSRDFSALPLIFGRILPLVFVTGYIVSFLVLLLKNSGFSSVKSAEKIMLISGRLPHRTTVFDARSVRAVKTVTAPLMLLAGKCAVKFSSCGFGRHTGEIGLLVPCVKPTLATGLLQWLLPKFDCEKNGYKAHKKAVKRALTLPMVFIAMLFCLTYAVAYFFKEIKYIIFAVFCMALAVTVIFVTVRVIGSRSGCLSCQDDVWRIKYRQGFKISELTVKTDDIRCIRIMSTPFDRRVGQCSVKLYLFGKNQDRANLKFADYFNTSRFVKTKLR